MVETIENLDAGIARQEIGTHIDYKERGGRDRGGMLITSSSPSPGGPGLEVDPHRAGPDKPSGARGHSGRAHLP